MKNRIFYLFGILVALIVACSDGGDDIKSGTPSEEVSSYLKMRFGNSRMESLDMAGANPAQSSYNGMMNNFGFNGGRLSGDSTEGGSSDDSIYVDPWEPWEWTSCAAITRSENTDGSITESYDYGDGCMEGYEGYQYLMKGKYTQTYKNNYNQEGKVYSDNYFYDVDYDNYGGTYYGEWYPNGESSWNIDGFSTYTGSSTYDEESQTYSGSYTYESETVYEWDTYKYYYKSDGASHYNQTTSTSEGSYEYRDETEDYFYGVDILSPLVYDYSCYTSGAEDAIAPSSYWFFTYVSGVESIRFTENGESGAFTIDYGNGECDNIVTITENGVSYTVDLADLYSDDYVVAVEPD